MLSKRAEFNRGWTVVLAAAVGAGTGVSALTFYTLGAFIEPLSQDMGWTRAQISAAPLFMTAASLIMGPVAGALADKYGARPVAIFSQIMFVLAVAGLALTTDAVWTFYAGFFLLAFVGCGTMPITWTRAITGWFFSARGLALGFALMGTGVMGMVAPSLATALIGEYGWRLAYVGLACVPLFIGLPLAILFFRDPPTNMTADGTSDAAAWGLTFAEAVRTRLFWQMSAGFFIAAMGIGAMLVHALPLLVEHGLERSTAAQVAGLFGLSVTLGRIFTGYLLDRMFGPTVALVMFAAPALGCVMILVAGNNVLVCAAAIVIFGLAAGAEFDIAAYFVARYFGRKNYGAIYGLLYTIFVVGSAVTPPLAGAVFDKYRTYDPALMAGIGIFIIAAILCGTLGAYPKETERG
ncbi:MAG: MFS transporter [Rhodospirillaceae bacterium]|nr:MFS transporter [Rhodospirillaceae bacterium]